MEEVNDDQDATAKRLRTGREDLPPLERSKEPQEQLEMSAEEADMEEAPDNTDGEVLQYIDQIMYQRWRKLIAANTPDIKMSKDAVLAIAHATLSVTRELIYHMVEYQIERQHGLIPENDSKSKTLTLQDADLLEILETNGHPHAFLRATLQEAAEFRRRRTTTNADSDDAGAAEGENIPAAVPTTTLHNFFPTVRN